MPAECSPNARDTAPYRAATYQSTSDGPHALLCYALRHQAAPVEYCREYDRQCLRFGSVGHLIHFLPCHFRFSFRWRRASVEAIGGARVRRSAAAAKPYGARWWGKVAAGIIARAGRGTVVGGRGKRGRERGRNGVARR